MNQLSIGFFLLIQKNKDSEAALFIANRHKTYIIIVPEISLKFICHY